MDAKSVAKTVVVGMAAFYGFRIAEAILVSFVPAADPDTLGERIAGTARGAADAITPGGAS